MTYNSNSGTIRFRTLTQKILWDLEITGQLSDGMWENTRPMDHWEPWCRAECVVDPVKQGRNFWPRKSNYNLNSKELLDCVGERMITYVKLGAVYGQDMANDLQSFYCGLKGTFQSPATYEGKYWDDLRARVATIPAEDVKAIIENNSYTMKDLRKDLKEMKVAMKKWVE